MTTSLSSPSRWPEPRPSGLLGGDPFESPSEGLVQALARGVSRTRARELPMPRKPNLPNLREHDARRILAKCRHHSRLRAQFAVQGVAQDMKNGGSEDCGQWCLPPVLRGSNLVASSLNTCAI